MRSWETTWLQIAFCMSQRSRDPRLRVGCVIVRDDRHIEGIGYNGDELGGANVPESLEPGLSGFVHAELNALIKARSAEGCVLYVTHSPCKACAKAIVNARIKRVVYTYAYRDETALALLEQAGIRAEQHNPMEIDE